ncbi:MAG: DUF21 domain-containing protein [Candidatus Omnitrophica bacterium]|nr:DUF21 domain-containing protein [Candidatus Omnitrophota bacterium]
MLILVVEFLIIVFMIVVTAFLAAYEMALASISRPRLAVLLGENKKGASEAVFMKDRMEASLAIVQLGINLVGALAAATGGVGVEGKIGPWLQTTYGLPLFAAKIIALFCLILPLTFLTIVLGE